MGEILWEMGTLRYGFITLLKYWIVSIPIIYAFIFDNKLTGIWKRYRLEYLQYEYYMSM